MERKLHCARRLVKLIFAWGNEQRAKEVLWLGSVTRQVVYFCEERVRCGLEDTGKT